MKNQKIEHALIMAAGRGMRMMPLTAIIPKPMAPYQESTLIADGIKKIKEHVRNVHVTVGYKGALLAKHIIEVGVDTIFDTNDKGNSWWVYNTLIKYLDRPIFVLTSDNVIELDFDMLTKNYFDYGSPSCMVIPVIPKHGLDGDYIFHDSQIVTAIDRNRVAQIYCSGIQILNPYKINQITQSVDNFYLLWNQLIAQKQLYCSDIYPKKWIAIDTIEELEVLNSGKSK